MSHWEPETTGKIRAPLTHQWKLESQYCVVCLTTETLSTFNLWLPKCILHLSSNDHSKKKNKTPQYLKDKLHRSLTPAPSLYNEFLSNQKAENQCWPLNKKSGIHSFIFSEHWQQNRHPPHQDAAWCHSPEQQVQDGDDENSLTSQFRLNSWVSPTFSEAVGHTTPSRKWPGWLLFGSESFVVTTQDWRGVTHYFKACSHIKSVRSSWWLCTQRWCFPSILITGFWLL